MDKITLILIGLLLVFVAYLLFALVYRNPISQKKVQIREDFNQFIEHFDQNDSMPSLKLFYVDWCGYCKNFKPVFDRQLPSVLERENIQVNLQAIDCESDPDAARKYQVKGYPTLIFESQNNDIVEYQGERSADAIVSWIRGLLK